MKVTVFPFCTLIFLCVPLIVRQAKTIRIAKHPAPCVGAHRAGQAIVFCYAGFFAASSLTSSRDRPESSEISSSVIRPRAIIFNAVSTLALCFASFAASNAISSNALHICTRPPSVSFKYRTSSARRGFSISSAFVQFKPIISSAKNQADRRSFYSKLPLHPFQTEGQFIFI